MKDGTEMQNREVFVMSKDDQVNESKVILWSKRSLLISSPGFLPVLISSRLSPEKEALQISSTSSLWSRKCNPLVRNSQPWIFGVTDDIGDPFWGVVLDPEIAGR